MKRKSTLTIIPLMVFILLVTGCSTNIGHATQIKQEDQKINTAQAPVENSATEKNLLTIKTSASLTKIDSVESLVSKSTVIVEGVVVGLDYFDYKINTFTKAKIKVLNSFTDVVKAGEIVTFVEPGGITTLDKRKVSDEGKPGGFSPITEQDKNTKVQVLFDGCPLLKLNDQVVFFGVEDKEDFYKLSEKYYDSIGAYQGRFNIKGDISERYSPEGTESISSLKMPKSDLEEKIKKSVHK